MSDPQENWWQRFSERYYHPYFAWWYSLRTNVIAGMIVVIGLLIFYLSFGE